MALGGATQGNRGRTVWRRVAGLGDCPSVGNVGIVHPAPVPAVRPVVMSPRTSRSAADQLSAVAVMAAPRWALSFFAKWGMTYLPKRRMVFITSSWAAGPIAHRENTCSMPTAS